MGGVGRQRMYVEGTKRRVIMEQVYREYDIEDVNEALDVLIQHYGKQGNVLDAVNNALIQRALDQATFQNEAGKLLGLTPRMINYHAKRLAE